MPAGGELVKRSLKGKRTTTCLVLPSIFNLKLQVEPIHQSINLSIKCSFQRDHMLNNNNEKKKEEQEIKKNNNNKSCMVLRQHSGAVVCTVGLRQKVVGLIPHISVCIRLPLMP